MVPCQLVQRQQQTAAGLGAELGERTGLAGSHCTARGRPGVEVQVAVGRATRGAARGAEEAVAAVGDLGR